MQDLVCEAEGDDVGVRSVRRKEGRSQSVRPQVRTQQTQCGNLRELDDGSYYGGLLECGCGLRIVFGSTNHVNLAHSRAEL